MDAAHTTKGELALSAFIGVYPRLISFRALWPLEHIPQREMYNSRLARRLDPPEIPVVQLRYRLSENSPGSKCYPSDAGREPRQFHAVSSVQRQLLNARADYFTDRRGARVDTGRLGCYGDALVDLSDRKHGIDTPVFIDLQRDSVLHHPPESLFFERHRIPSNGQLRNQVPTVAVGQRSR